MAQSNRYGFRAYTLSVGKGNRWRNAESLTDLGPAYMARIHALLVAARGNVLRYTPDLSAEDGVVPEPESTIGEPVMVIDRVEQCGRMLRCEVVKGTLGDHDELVGEDVVAITDQAAGRRYRIDIYFPCAEERGMVVAETCVRYTPVSLLLRWVAWFDKQRASEVAVELQEGLANGTLTEAQVKDREEAAHWRKLRTRQVSDGQYLRSLIKEAKKVSVGLSQANSFTDRGRPKDLQRRLEILNIGEGMHEALAEEVLHWLDGDKDGALRRVMGLVHLNKDSLAKDGLNFNNTSVRLEGSQSVTLTPDSVRDLFTYPLAASLRPNDAQWERVTRPKLIELAQLEEVALEL